MQDAFSSDDLIGEAEVSVQELLTAGKTIPLLCDDEVLRVSVAHWYSFSICVDAVDGTQARTRVRHKQVHVTPQCLAGCRHAARHRRHDQRR